MISTTLYLTKILCFGLKKLMSVLLVNSSFVNYICVGSTIQMKSLSYQRHKWLSKTTILWRFSVFHTIAKLLLKIGFTILRILSCQNTSLTSMKRLPTIVNTRNNLITVSSWECWLFPHTKHFFYKKMVYGVVHDFV